MPYKIRGRGHISAPTSRSGKQYNYAGRRVAIQGDTVNLTWNGPLLEAMLADSIIAALSSVSDEALSYMQSIVPYDTGALHDSCFVQIIESEGRMQLVIGADTPYAIYVELGSSRNMAQPYIRPTFDFVLRILPAALKNEVASRAH